MIIYLNVHLILHLARKVLFRYKTSSSTEPCLKDTAGQAVFHISQSEMSHFRAHAEDKGNTREHITVKEERHTPCTFHLSHGFLQGTEDI